MKKHFLGLLITFCMGLFVASCSEDDNKKGGADAGQARISAILPGDFISTGVRAVSSHQLRCILEVWSKDAEAKLIYQEEVTVDPAVQAGSLPFDFALPAGSYNCLMWADYIDAGATTDKYYDTSDLKNVTVKEGVSLINNKACDAFFYSGEIEKKEGEALQQEMKLLRPFTKVSVLEKNLKEYKRLKGLTVSYEASMKFNVSTGKASEETATVNYAESNFNPEAAMNQTLFTAYFFTNEESRKLGEINLSFTTDLGVQDVVIPEIIPLLRNQHIKVSGNMMAESPDPDNEFEISFDVEVEEWGTSDQEVVATDPKARVGDFFYADGSYASAYLKDEANPCIGVVFAVAHDGGTASGDQPENYVDNNGNQKLQKVHGWVIALKDVTSTGKEKIMPYTEGAALDLNTLPGSALNAGKSDMKGFLNTEAFKNEGVNLEHYPIAKAIINGESSAPGNTSGWYWGALDQYMTLSKAYATVSGGVEQLQEVGKSLQTLIDAGIADAFSMDGEQFYFSSTTETEKAADIGKLYRVGLLTSAKNYGQTAAWATNNPRHARAILTF